MDPQTAITLTLGTLSLALSGLQAFFSWKCLIVLQHENEDVSVQTRQIGRTEPRPVGQTRCEGI